MQLNPTLFFTGNAEEVLNYYRGALGGTVTIARYKDAPPGMGADPDFGDKVMYGTLETPFGTISAMDAPPGREGTPGSNFGISVTADCEDGAVHSFTTLSAGGQVLMPFEKTFFADKFGMTIDKFGIRWLISYRLAGASAAAQS